ncbi:hypothetical protein RHSIM_Rhsim02G0121400 [Rhododendron simsii]|uniref:CTLH domain-containing protein n=2 Tax=Magnoliopsida TaxID=3398 RepID=A0A834HDP8_RHOSS|nr:hypothetical protein RHSIM_Rhsim02G0121400 [Rhododendron simsii]
MVVVAVKEAKEFILAMREQIPVPRQLRMRSGELDGLAEAGAGIVVRDSNGSFVAAHSFNLGVVGSPLCAKAMVWQAVFDFAILLGLDSHVMERDSQQLVRRIQDMSDRQCHLTLPLPDLGTQFSSFEDSSTSPVMANANEDANEMGVRVDVEANDKVIDVVEEEEPNPFEKKHIDKGIQRRLKIGVPEKRQKTLSFEAGGSESGNLTTFTYDHAKVRDAASQMILYHEYPFMHMEHILFNKFMRTATPHWQKISRATAKNDCISTYQVQKKKLKTSLKHVGRISITTDLWKSPGQRTQYMVATGHYVDEFWKLQKRVLSFCNVPPPHNGVIIFDALYKCLVDWEIENKVATISVDNASYNDVALKNLKSTFHLLKKKLPLDGKLFHVRCCTHILNLMVQDGLVEIKGITDCVRDGVKYLIHSEARLIQFSNIAKQLKLPSRKLILDCPTRWNSTYFMLSAALEFKDVFPRKFTECHFSMQILDTNPQLFFHLQQQRLIELIRKGKVEEALEFAQEELAPRGEENQSFLEELERTVALLAFEDVSNCPVGELLDISQRLKTASEVNAAILTSQSHEKG